MKIESEPIRMHVTVESETRLVHVITSIERRFMRVVIIGEQKRKHMSFEGKLVRAKNRVGIEEREFRPSGDHHGHGYESAETE